MATIVDRRGSEWWVWDVGTLDWVKGEQPLLEAGSVMIPGTVTVTGTVTANAGTNLNTSALATQATLASLLTELQLKADLTETQPVSLAATVQADVTDEPARDLGKVDIASLDQYTPVSGRLPVDGSGVTQPVSGTVNTKTALTASTPTYAEVDVTSAEIVASNSSRKGLILVNNSVNRITLGFGSTPVLDRGVTLHPQGAYNMGEYDFSTAAVNAIASATLSVIGIQEYT